MSEGDYIRIAQANIASMIDCAIGVSVFNQYYFELLKKIRDKARSKKFDSREARHILKGVKANFQQYDKSSPEYRDWFSVQWSGQEGDQLYNGIMLSDVRAVLDNSVLDHFISILKVFMDKDMSDSDISSCVKALRVLNNKEEFSKAVEEVSNDGVKASLQVIQHKHVERKGSEMDEAMKRIEGTSLGKLAKEIMNDVNIEEIQKSVVDGDILKSLSNPDGPLTKVLSTVSAKMIAKMASGELKQESLLEDAMKLAGDLGINGGGLGGLGGLGDIGEMIKQMQAMGLGGRKPAGVPARRPNARQVRRKMKPHKPVPPS